MAIPTTSKLPLNKPMTRLVGQILTYYYNAIVDAKITDEFVKYFQTGGRAFATQDTVTQLRAQLLTNSVEQMSNDFLIGLAFTIYRTNGYGNYIVGKRMLTALRSKHKPQIEEFIRQYVNKLETELDVFHNYEQERDGWIPFFGFWAEASMRTFKFAHDFASERFGHADKLDKKQIVQACLAVQQQNSAHNLDVGQRILNGDHQGDHKIRLLHEVAQQLDHSQVFLNSCALTQKIQAHSDKTLIGVLKIRFPKTWVSLNSVKKPLKKVGQKMNGLTTRLPRRAGRRQEA